jgi:hypothetical protein
MSGPIPKPIAFRLDEALLQKIDKKRMSLAQETGTIPTRSDIVRLALESYLSETVKSPKRK